MGKRYRKNASTTTALSVAGRIEAKFKITLFNNKGQRIRRGIQTGEATIKNTTRDLRLGLEKARADAIAQFIKNEGFDFQNYEALQQAMRSRATAELIDYNILYNDDVLVIRRKNIKGRYFSVARDKSSNKILSKVRWSSKKKELL